MVHHKGFGVREEDFNCDDSWNRELRDSCSQQTVKAKANARVEWPVVHAVVLVMMMMVQDLLV